MRIIGGSRRGKKLHRPRDLSIRPTADRVRESIFNIIQHRVPGAYVLDLFAGTGAMGLEALSRGAEQTVFIDNHPAALTLIKKNVRACRWETRARIIRWDITRELGCIRFPKVLYDLVFIDPPYLKNLAPRALEHLDRSLALAKEARVVVEHDRADSIDIDSTAFVLEDQRAYGKTLVSFLRYVI